jgi:hypothetical protein
VGILLDKNNGLQVKRAFSKTANEDNERKRHRPEGEVVGHGEWVLPSRPASLAYVIILTPCRRAPETSQSSALPFSIYFARVVGAWETRSCTHLNDFIPWHSYGHLTFISALGLSYRIPRVISFVSQLPWLPRP